MQGHEHKKKTVKLGGVTLGAGMPAVCVPVMGERIAALAAAAERARLAEADVIELRMDSMDAMPDVGAALEAIAAVKRAAESIPLLFTLRTQRDGACPDHLRIITEKRDDLRGKYAAYDSC